MTVRGEVAGVVVGEYLLFGNLKSSILQFDNAIGINKKRRVVNPNLLNFAITMETSLVLQIKLPSLF